MKSLLFQWHFPCSLLLHPKNIHILCGMKSNDKDVETCYPCQETWTDGWGQRRAFRNLLGLLTHTPADVRVMAKGSHGVLVQVPNSQVGVEGTGPVAVQDVPLVQSRNCAMESGLLLPVAASVTRSSIPWNSLLELIISKFSLLQAEL